MSELASREKVDALDGIFLEAFKAGASDVHFEVHGRVFRVRMRVDAGMMDVAVKEEIKGEAVLARIKLLANLDIQQTRKAQDGRIDYVLPNEGGVLRMRVSVVPLVDGESVVLRVLNNERQDFDYRRLRIPEEVDAELREIAAQTEGLYLFTGATGSGKTTTLYTLLQYLDKGARKVMSVEDPVEYVQEGMVQTSVAGHIGLSFDRCVHAALRHDPDVIVIGEIRDPETAEAATRATLTGHLVLATLHARSAEHARARMLQLGVSAHFQDCVLRGVFYQELVADPEHGRVPKFEYKKTR